MPCREVNTKLQGSFVTLPGPWYFRIIAGIGLGVGFSVLVVTIGTVVVGNSVVVGIVVGGFVVLRSGVCLSVAGLLVCTNCVVTLASFVSLTAPLGLRVVTDWLSLSRFSRPTKYTKQSFVENKLQDFQMEYYCIDQNSAAY